MLTPASKLLCIHLYSACVMRFECEMHGILFFFWWTAAPGVCQSSANPAHTQHTSGACIFSIFVNKKPVNWVWGWARRRQESVLSSVCRVTGGGRPFDTHLTLSDDCAYFYAGEVTHWFLFCWRLFCFWCELRREFSGDFGDFFFVW